MKWILLPITLLPFSSANSCNDELTCGQYTCTGTFLPTCLQRCSTDNNGLACDTRVLCREYYCSSGSFFPCGFPD